MLVLTYRTDEFNGQRLPGMLLCKRKPPIGELGFFKRWLEYTCIVSAGLDNASRSTYTSMACGWAPTLQRGLTV